MILITGAAGFLGGFLVDEFLKHGFKVRALARPTSDLSHLKKTTAHIVFADITNTNQVKNTLCGVDEVVHAAAILGGRDKKREDYLKVNYHATKNLARCCIEKKIKRFTFISSIAAVGPGINKKTFLDENSQFNPVSFYGESKRLSEEYLLSLSNKKKLEVVIIRPALIYGPRDRRCAVNYFRIANLGFFPLPLPADNKTSFIYVSDAARAIFLAHTQSVAGEIYMLANDVVTVKEFVKKLLLTKGGISLLIPISPVLINIIASISGFVFMKKRWSSNTIDRRIKDIGRGNWAVDNSKIREALNFSHHIDLTEGLRETWRFYSKHKKLLSFRYLLRNF